MATSPYLAMTAAEYHAASSLPSHLAWMACHFSPYALGLSNLPEELPADSILVLSDIIPIQRHNPEVIAQQLADCIQKHCCRGVLLDFQRSPCTETETLTNILIQALTCPVAVSEPFAHGKNCSVFLPPCPPHIPLKEYIAPWKNRKIWIEVACSSTQLLLTSSGTVISHEMVISPEGPVYSEEQLHCHYHTQVTDASARFYLWRTEDDLKALIEEGDQLGIRQFVGLFQELASFFL